MDIPDEGRTAERGRIRTSSRCCASAASRPFFWTQFLGAGNDNLFKFAFTVMVTYQLQVELAAAGSWPAW